ncbi:MAG: DUF4129 domain-containing protein [Bacteroidota bacterium]
MSYFSSEIVQPRTFQDSLYTDTGPLEVREYENLKDKYDDDDFIYERSVADSGWWTRFKKWLSDFFRDLFDLNSAAQASNFTDIALKVFYVVIFLLVVFFIVKAIINKEGTWVFGKSSDKNIIPVTDVENNIHVTDFNTLIEQAESKGNFRLAVRYYYLWLLKKLSEAEIIDYDVEKTNSDYYYEIKPDDVKKQYSYTSYLYNYIWYGEFEIDKNQFDKAKNAFAQFLNSIKK